MKNSRREHLEQIYFAAVESVHPSHIMSRHISINGDRLQLGEDIVPVSSFKKIYVAGAGKGAGEMAMEVERILGDMITDGVVAVKNFPSFTMKYIRPIVAGHPTPNENSVIAANDLLQLLNKINQDDLLIFLLCGGASSLITDLPAFVSLKELNQLYSLLITSGADIHEINTVRKNLSEIKGGGVAKKCRGRIACFIISDVPGNDLSVIGSGPTTPNESTFDEALQILRKYNLASQVSPAIMQVLQNGANGLINETKNENDRTWNRCRNFIIGDNKQALQAAAHKAAQLGYSCFLYPGQLTSDTVSACDEFLKWIISHNNTQLPACFIVGGETTLQVSGIGTGGRNQHFALVALQRMIEEKTTRISILAAGTDGSDGPTDAAGAFADSQTLQRASDASLDAGDYLENFNSYHFFKTSESLFVPGPTGTNVMDIIVALTWPQETSEQQH